MRRPLLALVPLVLASCTLVIGGRPETCGTYPDDGGPAVLVTRDQELCEIVRLRTARGLASVESLTQEQIDALLGRVASWSNERTMASLAARIRSEAGDPMADDVLRSFDAVRAGSSRPIAPECEADERCWVRGAVRGIEIALLYAQPSAPPEGEPDEPPASR